ncbi:leucine-rich repeats and immunoglobulin-like domains protein sma-10 [Pecten maximus]|uniref:leucine-rich repeats and immunoglobulin-like domains protein sma-10 n=1 Tax=Pecten maximus TaxID=6579 RepID=UPI001458B586|nr:leucine-rich repeats and immunoglobulin-like domains protein sma-10 [Pecten maximus]
MEHTFLSVVILLVWSLPAVVTRCSLSTSIYHKTIYCYQDQTNVIPSFPQYNGTLKRLGFYGEWIVRNLDKNSFSGITLVDQLELENIGLQHLSCDVFINVEQELTILNLDNNMLTHFPACSVNNLYHLRMLTLSKNFLTCIPGHSVPSSLQHLDVSYNQIYTLSSAISTDVYNKNQLKTFNIRGNKLHRISKNELQQFSSLENLDARENLLDYIQPRSFVTSGGHLTTIDLSQNQLSGDVWPCLEHLQQVTNLNLSHNQIDRVDDNVVSNMENLQTFDISYNLVSEVGPAFGHQQTLRTVLFHHNVITKVTEDIFAAGTRFRYWFDLDLSFNLLVSVDLTIPDCLYCTLLVHHNKLHMMRLSSNQNSTFSLIDISFNVLDTIPPYLPKWTKFDGSHNPFSTTSVMDFLTHLPDRTTHDVILKNTTFLCKQTSIPEIKIFSQITLDLADNCVPSQFLCQLRSNVSSLYGFHGNPLVCSCSTVWLRNYTFTTDLGQCSYPVERKGSAVTCLATLPCDTGQSVYSSKENIQACKTGLVLTNENQNLKWDLPLGKVHTTPQSQANVRSFQGL